jgi:hypothetical protein
VKLCENALSDALDFGKQGLAVKAELGGVCDGARADRLPARILCGFADPFAWPAGQFASHSRSRKKLLGGRKQQPCVAQPHFDVGAQFFVKVTGTHRSKRRNRGIRVEKNGAWSSLCC